MKYRKSTFRGGRKIQNFYKRVAVGQQVSLFHRDGDLAVVRGDDKPAVGFHASRKALYFLVHVKSESNDVRVCRALFVTERIDMGEVEIGITLRVCIGRRGNRVVDCFRY